MEKNQFIKNATSLRDEQINSNQMSLASEAFIDEYNQFPLRVYPNPFESFIIIESPFNDDIEIYSTEGLKIYSTKIEFGNKYDTNSRFS